MTNNLETIPMCWENKPKQRYYRVIIQQNLFGVWLLLCIWGGVQRKWGWEKTIIDDLNQRIDILKTILTYWEKRRYNIVSTTQSSG